MARAHNGGSIADVIARKHNVATDAEVESLAREHYQGSDVATRGAATYLRVLVAGCQSRLGAPRRGRPTRGAADAQGTVVEAVHSRFYNAVLRGITTEDVAPDTAVDAAEQRRRTLERNRRSAFARSAAATLRLYVNGGGDIRALNADTVTKAELRAAVAPPEPADKVARQIQRAQGALMRAIVRRARGDPDAAAEAAEAAIAALESLLVEPEPAAAAPPVRRPPEENHAESTVMGSHRGTRVIAPAMVHSPAAR